MPALLSCKNCKVSFAIIYYDCKILVDSLASHVNDFAAGLQPLHQVSHFSAL